MATVLQVRAQQNPCEGKSEGDAVGCNVANQLMVCRETAKGVFAAEPDPNSKCEARRPDKKNNQAPTRAKANPASRAKSARPAASANTCVALRQKIIAEVWALARANCGGYAPRVPVDAIVREKKSVIARCPQYAPYGDETIWPFPSVGELNSWGCAFKG
jgi:hypothetical protein